MENEDQYQEVSEAKYDCLLFDLDDTLYPLSSGLSLAVRKNIQEYMLQKLGIDEGEVSEVNFQLYKTYGTTMAGLKAIGYDFDYDDFHSFVHGRLSYDIVKPDPVLRGLLLSLPVQKVVTFLTLELLSNHCHVFSVVKMIFTNPGKVHAFRVLHWLGLQDCFERVICFETLNPSDNVNSPEEGDGSKASSIFNFYEYIPQPNSGMVLPRTPVVCKPFEDAFQKVFKIVNIDPRRTKTKLPIRFQSSFFQ